MLGSFFPSNLSTRLGFGGSDSWNHTRQSTDRLLQQRPSRVAESVDERNPKRLCGLELLQEPRPAREPCFCRGGSFKIRAAVCDCRSGGSRLLGGSGKHETICEELSQRLVCNGCGAEGGRQTARGRSLLLTMSIDHAAPSRKALPIKAEVFTTELASRVNILIFAPSLVRRGSGRAANIFG
jgi:hypothetical protein